MSAKSIEKAVDAMLQRVDTEMNSELVYKAVTGRVKELLGDTLETIIRKMVTGFLNRRWLYDERESPLEHVIRTEMSRRTVASLDRIADGDLHEMIREQQMLAMRLVVFDMQYRMLRKQAYEQLKKTDPKSPLLTEKFQVGMTTNEFVKKAMELLDLPVKTDATGSAAPENSA